MKTYNQGYIYSLDCPITGEPKYVGQTVNLKGRFANHIHSYLSKDKNKKNSWIKSLKKKELEPILTVIEECSSEELNFWECHYISLYRSWGFKLKNHDMGGSYKLGKRHSEETKLKMSLAAKGKPKSEEHKRKQSLSCKGRTFSEETLTKMRKPRSEEGKKNISNGCKGKKKTVPSKLKNKPWSEARRNSQNKKNNNNE